MAAHIWLGLLAAPLVLLHAGFVFGGMLSWLLAWTFMIVVASGIFGLVMQNVVPRLMTEAVPDESIYSQIDELGRQLAADAVRLAQLYAGADESGQWAELAREPGELSAARASGAQVAGAPRLVGTIVPRTTSPRVDLTSSARSPELHRALEEELVEFLRTGASPSGRLATAQRSAWYFEDLQRRVRPEVRPAVAELQELCQRRRQLNLQRRLHVWLHGWLLIHLPLSAALLLLLAAHIAGAVVYS
jgi:hypothetical protein